MSKTVTYKMDLNNPPVLSEEQKARLEALAKRPDSEIDFSDIPELDENFWKNEGHEISDFEYHLRLDAKNEETGEPILK